MNENDQSRISKEKQLLAKGLAVASEMLAVRLKQLQTTKETKDDGLQHRTSSADQLLRR